MPRVEIVQKHNTAARRLYIRGHNGKVSAVTEKKNFKLGQKKLMYWFLGKTNLIINFN